MTESNAKAYERAVREGGSSSASFLIPIKDRDRILAYFGRGGGEMSAFVDRAARKSNERKIR